MRKQRSQQISVTITHTHTLHKKRPHAQATEFHQQPHENFFAKTNNTQHFDKTLNFHCGPAIWKLEPWKLELSEAPKLPMVQLAKVEPSQAACLGPPPKHQTWRTYSKRQGAPATPCPKAYPIAPQPRNVSASNLSS